VNKNGKLMNDSMQWGAIRWSVLASVSLLALTGCAVPQAFQTPAVTLPAAYSQATGTPVQGQAASADDWWLAFNDPQLNALVTDVLARNNNLAAASLRVRRAQLQAGLAAEQASPQFSATATADSSRALESGATNVRSNSVRLGVSYELDLWRRLASQQDAARWEALATAQDVQSTRLALVATTARLYWQQAFVQQRLAANADSIAYAQTTLRLIEAQYRAGAVSGLELAEARQALAAQQASQPVLQQQLTAARTALALLFNAAPGTADVNARAAALPQALPTGPLPSVQPGLPAALLGQRPDLRAAELRLRQSLASTDAARASAYPAFTLTGSLGSTSTALSSVLLNIRVSQAQYEEAVLLFRQTLYTALGEVDDALGNRAQLALQAERLQEALQAAQTAERLYEVRYRAGAAPLKAWLDAQEKRRSADIALADNRLGRLNNQLALFQALGGGAEDSPAAAR
jgi:NodT family efflux transporter outer membrane factor (OMF) lipoprotein